MVLRKSFYIRWSAGRSPRVHEVNPGRDPSIRVPLVEVLMITNQGYWLLMVKDELSDRLKLIKHQMKII